MAATIARRQSVLNSNFVQPPPSLTILLRRLEAATSRLEDIASSVTVFEGSAPSPSVSSSQINGTPTPSSQPTPTPASKAIDKPIDLPIEIEVFDKIINGDLAKFVKLSQFEPLLAEQAKVLKEAFEAERTVLLLSTKAKKPIEGSTEYMEVYQELQSKVVYVSDIREKNRASPLKEHLALIADGSQTLGWIAIDNKPAEQAAELFGGAQMYGNKILRAHKDG
jgi:adenylyl cyclase-associated protein